MDCCRRAICCLWTLDLNCKGLSEEEALALQNKLDAFYTIMNQEMEVTSDAAVYNPHLDSDPDMNDQYSDDVMDGQISDSEADRDRLMINYTEHFDPSIRSTSDDIREEFVCLSLYMLLVLDQWWLCSLMILHIVLGHVD